MTTRLPISRLVPFAGALLATGLLILGGCGEKITIPQAHGFFGNKVYHHEDTYPDADPVQVGVVNNLLFVLTAGDGCLTKRSWAYEEIARACGFGEPTAFCADDMGQIIFVWDQADRTVTYLESSGLGVIGSISLATDDRQVQSCVAMAACSTGVWVEPGARTFLYLADPDSGVVHRYVFDEFSGLRPFGLLARSDGDAARFVHLPAGLARDAEGMLLVCDADTNRNWVIRFDPSPDFEDATPDPDDQDPWRGKATLFDLPTCEPPAATDFTLGDAAGCGESGWAGGPSSELGEFHSPLAVAVDGSGRIYVADSGNDRVQIFYPQGYYDMQFGTPELTPGVSSVALVDVRTGAGLENLNFGAYVFAVVATAPDDSTISRVVQKFISDDQYFEEYEQDHPDNN